jgi:trimeric autotransporter adhesin
VTSYSIFSKIWRAGLTYIMISLLFNPILAAASQSYDAAISPSSSPGDIGWQGGFSVNGMNSDLKAIATDGKIVYVGGAFNMAGDTAANMVSIWDGTSWHALGEGIDHTVYALAVDGRGNVYAGGLFQHAGGKPTKNIARWNGLAWETLADGLNGMVSDLVVDAAGHLYACGSFMTAGDVQVNGVAMWDGSAWHSLAGGVSNGTSGVTVWSLAIDKYGYVYAGGQFSSAGGTPVNNIGRWDGTRWSSVGEGIGAGEKFPGVYALATDTRDNLYAGGSFSRAGSVEALNIARWNGEAWSALGDGVGLPIQGAAKIVQSILTDGGIVYVGGEFNQAGETPVNGLARWNGAAWENINYGKWSAYSLPEGEPDVSIAGLAMDRDGRLFAAGDFKIAGGKSANHVAMLDGVNWNGLGVDNGVDDEIQDIVLDQNGGYYITGKFTCAWGKIVDHIAHWNGSNWTDLAGGLTGIPYPYPRRMVVDHAGNLYVGGDFVYAGDKTVHSIAKWNGVEWQALGSGLNGNVTAMAVDSQDHLYVSGYFSTAGSVPANGIAEWTGTQWLSLRSDITAFAANALVVDDQDRLIAGGWFDSIDGVQVNGLARWDGKQWESISDDVQRWVTSLLFKDGTLYLAGTAVWKLQSGIFEQLGGQLADTNYPPSIDSLVFDGQGRLVAAGAFEKIGNVSAKNIARWNGTTWESLGSGTNSQINAVVLDNQGNLLVGGFFSQAGGKVSMYLANWDEPFYQWLPWAGNR